MKYAVIGARILLGLIFFVFGLNGFLNFIEAPPMTGDASTFIGILAGSGYLYVVKLIEIVGGLALLTGRFVPLGLTLLGPVIVNIMLFHGFLAPEGLPVPIVTVLLEGFLIWAYRKNFAPVFAAVAKAA